MRAFASANVNGDFLPASREGASMSFKKVRTALGLAAFATIEPLERRQLLTTCSFDGVRRLTVKGDNAANNSVNNNNIVITYNPSTTRVSVSDTIAGVDAACSNV